MDHHQKLFLICGGFSLLLCGWVTSLLVSDLWTLFFL